MSKTLILITNHFPFGSAEAFIETEYPFLENKFSNIHILCRNVVSKEIRKGNYNYHRLNPESDWRGYALLITQSLKHFRKVVQVLTQEISYLKVKRKLNAPNLNTLMHDLSKALITSLSIEKIIKTSNISEDVVLYSYWLNSSALATIFVKSDSVSIKKISRTHGGDVYEERQSGNYLSFRNTLSKNLDAIFCSTQSGLDYLKLRIAPESHSKLNLARLGTSKASNVSYKPSSKKIIVSCSFLVSVKRIPFMIESLSLIKQEVEWIHIGGGPLEKKLMDLAHKKLAGSPVHYSFLGTLPSYSIMEFYCSTPAYLFMNTSSSEGIPVTMMEAQSFGIPILALNVGGVSEIVNKKNGILLPSDSTPEDFSVALSQMLNIPEVEYYGLRKEARQNWEVHYNAEKNFSTFADQISNLN